MKIKCVADEKKMIDIKQRGFGENNWYCIPKKEIKDESKENEEIQNESKKDRNKKNKVIKEKMKSKN